MDETNKQLQDEELLVLSSIYGPDFSHSPDLPDTASITIHLAPGPVILHCHFPTTYPSDECPYYELTADWRNRAGVSHGISDTIRRKVDQEFMDLFVPGEVVVYAWIARLQEILEEAYEREGEGMEDDHQQSQTGEPSAEHGAPSEPAKPSLKTQGQLDDTPELDFPMIVPPSCPRITHSPTPLIDRKSVFIAHLAPVNRTDEVQLVMEALLSNKRIARATHNIQAYRIIEANGVVRQDCDDDGETAAGARLLHMLTLAEANNVLVVVSRWYGGIHLGPARFKHINNVARQLLESCGYIKSATADGRNRSKGGKKK